MGNKKVENIAVNFVRQDIYDVLANTSNIAFPYDSYNVIVLQYMIAGHIHSDRAEKIEFLFDEIIDKFILRPRKSPLLLIINDIDHKAWICDYFNLFAKKLRKHGLTFRADKRHFEPRAENSGSKLYKTRSNRFSLQIPTEYRDKYNAHAPCSAAQLIIEVQ